MRLWWSTHSGLLVVVGLLWFLMVVCSWWVPMVERLEDARVKCSW